MYFNSFRAVEKDSISYNFLEEDSNNSQPKFSILKNMSAHNVNLQNIGIKDDIEVNMVSEDEITRPYNSYTSELQDSSSTSFNNSNIDLDSPYLSSIIYPNQQNIKEKHDNLDSEVTLKPNTYSSLNKYEVQYNEIQNLETNILFFNDLIEKVLEYPTKINNPEIYDKGIKLFTQISDLKKKEEILTKLIFLYPNKHELYHNMGNLFKQTDEHKALMWFNICYQKNPKYVENILDLINCILKLNKRNRKFAEYLIENNKDLQNIDDSRIKQLLNTIYVKDESNKNIDDEIDKMLNFVKTIEQYNTDGKYFVYFNLAELYSEKSDMEKFLFYTNKVIENELKIENKEIVLKPTYQNFLIKCDYIYTDNNIRQEINKKYATFFENKKEFCFELNRKKKCDKINIGYLSNSIFLNAISNFIFPILEYHNKEKFNVSIITELNKSYASKENVKLYKHLFENIGVKVIDISDKDTNEVANIINKNKIDILFDLDGHLKDNRLEVFSQNPAPIQISYLGYPNSTGMDFIKYRIVDHITDPSDSTQIYSEKRLYMPKCFLLFKSITQTKPLPIRLLNKDSTIVIGSVNKELKLNSELIDTWRKIMELCPNIKILIKIDKKDVSKKLEYFKKILCISEDRIIIKSACDNRDDYIKIYDEIDLFLDAFPYSGTTTTCNILYNSLPMITLYNKDYHAHCVSASFLINSGLGELVAYSMEEYIQKIVSLCNNYEKINKYKKKIGEQFMKLMDPEDFMYNYEELLIST